MRRNYVTSQFLIDKKTKFKGPSDLIKEKFTGFALFLGFKVLLSCAGISYFYIFLSTPPEQLSGDPFVAIRPNP